MSEKALESLRALEAQRVEELEQIRRVIALVERSNGPEAALQTWSRTATAVRKPTAGRQLSKAGRAAISAAAKKRWATWRRAKK